MQEFEREVELIDYIEIILKYKWLILLVTAVCALGAVVHNSRQPVSYEASAHLLVIPPENQAKGLRDTEVEPSKLTIQNYQSIAMSGKIWTKMEYVVDSIKTANRDIEQYAGYSPSVRIANQNSLILSVRSLDPNLPAPVINAWTDVFMALSKEMGAEETGGTYNFYQNQYEETQELLEGKEETLKAFNDTTRLAFLQGEKGTYDGLVKDIQTQVINMRTNIASQKDDLQRVEESVAALEVDDTPFYLVALDELQRLQMKNSLTNQVVANAIELELLKEAKRQFAEEEQMALLEFDKKHNFAFLEKRQDELQKTVDSYSRIILEAERTKLIGEKNIKGLTRELEKHDAKIMMGKAIGDEAFWVKVKGRPPSKEQTEGMDRLKLYSEEPNPIYQGLEQKIVEESSQVETAMILSEEGEGEVIAIESNLHAIKRAFYSIQRERNKLVDNLSQRRSNLDDQVENLQKIYDSNRRHYLSQKSRVEELLQAVLAQENQLVDLITQQNSLKTMAKDIQIIIGDLNIERARMVRDVNRYQDTFNKFAILVEDGRIAREKEASNIRLIDPATGAAPTSESNSQKVATSALAGLLISTVLVLLVEYVRRARAMRAG